MNYVYCYVIMNIVWGKWVSVLTWMVFFFFLYLGRHMMNSQLFQLIIFGMVLVMVAWCNAFLLEEKKRLHHKNGLNPNGQCDSNINQCNNIWMYFQSQWGPTRLWGATHALLHHYFLVVLKYIFRIFLIIFLNF